MADSTLVLRDPQGGYYPGHWDRPHTDQEQQDWSPPPPPTIYPPVTTPAGIRDIPRFYTALEIRPAKHTGLQANVVSYLSEGRWHVFIDDSGCIRAYLEEPTPQQWTLPEERREGEVLALYGRPQVCLQAQDGLLMIVSWKLHTIQMQRTGSMPRPSAAATRVITYRITFQFGYPVDASPIYGSANPVAVAFPWATFADLEGMPRVHSRNLEDDRFVDIDLDTWHGTVSGTYLPPYDALVLHNDEHGFLMTYTRASIEHKSAPWTSPAAPLNCFNRVRPVLESSIGGISHGWETMFHSATGKVLAVRRSTDLRLYCQAGMDDSKAAPSWWADVPIEPTRAISAICLGPQARSLWYIGHVIGTNTTYVTMAVLPPFPTGFRYAVNPELSIQQSNVAKAAGTANTLLHCNRMEIIEVDEGARTATLLVGQLETTLWQEIICKEIVGRNTSQPTPNISEWKLRGPTRALPCRDPSMLYARRAAGGVIEQAQVSPELGLRMDGVPALWSSPVHLRVQKERFYNPKGPQMILQQCYGVVRPLSLVGMDTDTYFSTWIAVVARPGLQEWRYIALRMSEDIGVDDSDSDTDMTDAEAAQPVARAHDQPVIRPFDVEFRYDDHHAKNALTLLRVKDAHMADFYKPAHPDAWHVYSSLVDDIAHVANQDTPLDLRQAIAARLGIALEAPLG